MVSIAASLRSMCGSERRPPECSTQWLPTATPHVGHGTEDICLGVSSPLFIGTEWTNIQSRICSIVNTVGRYWLLLGGNLLSRAGQHRAVVRRVNRKMRNGQQWRLRGVDIFAVRDGRVAACGIASIACQRVLAGNPRVEFCQSRVPHASFQKDAASKRLSLFLNKCSQNLVFGLHSRSKSTD